MSLAIETSGLTKIYRGKGWRRVEALVGLDLEVKRGEVFGFLGPNGAGKSTTIKTLLGLLRPSSGTALLDGVTAGSSQSRKSVGFLPENPTFYDFLSGKEYLAFVGRAFGLDGKTIGRRAGEVLERLELTAAAKRPIRSYSKGMVQRLGLAQTLLHDPDIYILDEPMSGLDPLGRALVKNLITELRADGKTVFFSTHITADVELVCDRVGVLVGGRLQALKPVQEILAEGVVGYQLKVRGVSSALVERYGAGGEGNEFFIPKEEFAGVVSELNSVGAVIELVEPRRKDLEAFFLDIVARSAK